MKLDDLNEWKVFIVKAKRQKVCTCRFSSLGHKKVQKYLSSSPSPLPKNTVCYFKLFWLKIPFSFYSKISKFNFFQINFLYNLSLRLILREDNTLFQSSSSCFVTSFERLLRLEKWRILHSEMRKGGKQNLTLPTHMSSFETMRLIFPHFSFNLFHYRPLELTVNFASWRALWQALWTCGQIFWDREGDNLPLEYAFYSSFWESLWSQMEEHMYSRYVKNPICI